MRTTKEKLQELGYREHPDGSWHPAPSRGGTSSVSKLEPNTRDGARKKDGAEARDQESVHISGRVRIEVVSHRSRFCDSDNLASKWFVDALVSCRVIDDDNPKFVESVTYRQIKCKRSEEKTVMEVYRA